MDESVGGANGDALGVSNGAPAPLGPSRGPDGGVNFAVVSINASRMLLCVCREVFNDTRIEEIEMHRTGDVWHVYVSGLASGTRYGVRAFGEGGWDTGNRWDSSRILLDPYAPLVSGRRVFGKRDIEENFDTGSGSQFWGTFDFGDDAIGGQGFDWGADYARPQVAWEDTVIYEMGVRLFTASETSGVAPAARGTYRGLMEKIPHLVDLGVTAVELLPIFEYDELEFQRLPNPRSHMTNVWGYSHISFFAPMSRFGSGGEGPIAASREFKTLVKALHAAGIEVLLDVVYNHTAEGGDVEPYVLSWRGIDADTYYMSDKASYVQLLNYSGCGNTVNANNPVVTQLILDSLRHWVEEYHVDGFRFDLASALCRDEDGTPMQSPPLIRAISKDAVLSRVKLISEPWDCGGLYQVGSFPNWDVWAEWNGRYRDDVRRFLKGDHEMKAEFATRLMGSADLYHYNNRKPFHSINFVIAHDGFTLRDLVSYNTKHNDANGEKGMDGSNDNFSWNCGCEGPTEDAGVNGLRLRQMKNFQLALMVSQGTPMFMMGDEYGRTTQGNNNTYGLDNAVTHFDWDALEEEREGYYRFFKSLIHFRRTCPLLGRREFMRRHEMTWHEDNWENPESCFLSFTLHGRSKGWGDLYVAFNAHEYWLENALPEPPAGGQWRRIADTNLPSPKDFDASGARTIDTPGVYRMAPYSAILLMSE